MTNTSLLMVLPNILASYGMFFLSSWCVASVAYLLGDHLWKDGQFFSVVVCFFLFQIVGCFFWGIFSDMYGRLLAIQCLSWKLAITILCLLCFEYFCEVNQQSDVLSSSYSNKPMGIQTSSQGLVYKANVTDMDWASAAIEPYINMPMESLSSAKSFFSDALSFFFKKTFCHGLISSSLLAIGGITLGAIHTVTPLLLLEVVSRPQRLVSLCFLFSMKVAAQLAVRCVIATVFALHPEITKKCTFTVLMGFSCVFCLALCWIIQRLSNQYCIKSMSTHSTPYEIAETNTFSSGIPQNAPGYEDLSPQDRTKHYYRLDSSSLIHLSSELFLKKCSLNPSQLDVKSHNSFSWTVYLSQIAQYMKHFHQYFLGCCLPWLILSLSFHNDGFVDYFFVYIGVGIQHESLDNLFKLSLACVTLIGTLLSIWCIVRFIPKLLQMLGFAVMGFVNFGLALSLFSIKHPVNASMVVPPVKNISAYFAASLLYQCVFSMGNLLPLLTCFMIPLKAFPIPVRGIFYGSVVASSKFGVVLGIWVSFCLTAWRRTRAFILALYSVTGLLGVIATRALTPDIRTF